jgi:hypothetical protein
MGRGNYWRKVVVISLVGMLGLAVSVQAEPFRFTTSGDNRPVQPDNIPDHNVC